MPHHVSHSYVLIEQLGIDASIGVFDWEREVKQRLLLDLRIKVDMHKAGQSDAIDDALSYAEVSEQLTAWVQAKHHDLLEYLAEQLLQRLYESYPEIEKVELSIRKPGAVPQAKAVGVELSSERVA